MFLMPRKFSLIKSYAAKRKDALMAKRFGDEATSSALPKEVFPLWFFDVCDFEVVKNHSRIVYRVHVDGEGYYLKITPEPEAKDVWPLDREKFELSTDFARHLCTMDAPLARPIASKRDRYVEEHTFEEVYMVVQVTASVPGTTVSTECKDPAVFERCGIALAKLHCAAESFPQISKYEKQAWERNWIQTGLNIPNNNQTLLSEYRKIDAWLNASRPLPGGKGLTHGDTGILNFIDDKNRVSLIDIFINLQYSFGIEFDKSQNVKP